MRAFASLNGKWQGLHLLSNAPEVEVAASRGRLSSKVEARGSPSCSALMLGFMDSCGSHERFREQEGDTAP